MAKSHSLFSPLVAGIPLAAECRWVLCRLAEVRSLSSQVASPAPFEALSCNFPSLSETVRMVIVLESFRLAFHSLPTFSHVPPLGSLSPIVSICSRISSQTPTINASGYPLMLKSLSSPLSDPLPPEVHAFCIAVLCIPLSPPSRTSHHTWQHPLLR